MLRYKPTVLSDRQNNYEQLELEINNFLSIIFKFINLLILNKNMFVISVFF